MKYLTIKEYSHNFEVTDITPRVRQVLGNFAKQFIQIDRTPQGRRGFNNPLPIKCVFASRMADKTSYRFHINTLVKFREYLTRDQVLPERINHIVVPYYTPKDIQFDIYEHWKPRPHQIPIIEYIRAADPKSKLIGLQTGQGKSFISMVGDKDNGLLPMYILKPGYIDKWIIDFKKTFIIESEDILVVKGAKGIQALLNKSAEGIYDYKLIVLSNRTLQDWITLYEEYGAKTLEMGYNCYPQDFMEKVRVGRRIIDEVHQNFHLNFKIDLFTHVRDSVSLSATMIFDDGFVNAMAEIAYPFAKRAKTPAYIKYIKASPWFYSIEEMGPIRTTMPGRTSYSHIAFEQSLLKSERRLHRYLLMITEAVRKTFMIGYRPGDKVAIYCALTEMCAKVAEYLQAIWPHLDVRKYTGEDDYENLMQADIAVTTVGSAGTNVDIPDLTTVIFTIAMTSSQGNIQGAGRLRELKDERPPWFIYFCCENIPKHVEYHHQKEKLLKDRAKYFFNMYHNVRI